MNQSAIEFQIVSDIHVEFMDKFPLIKPSARLLILAGDICKIKSPAFKPLFDYISNNWEHTYYVPGNHEYYSRHNISSLKCLYRKFFDKYKNITWLDDQVEYSGQYTIIGSTLWSAPNYTEGLNDFRMIKLNNRYITSSGMCTIHYESVKFLKEAIESADHDKPCIVVTHFPPLRKGTSASIYADSPHSKYFTNELTEMEIDTTYVNLWISGHTHYSYDFRRDGTQYVSNQIGYPGELKNTTYDKVVGI